MKPMHAKITRVRRCSCCVSKYSRGKKNNSGKSATRYSEKIELVALLKKGE